MQLVVKTVEQLRTQLRSLRKSAGLTQKQLGERLGLGQVRIAEIESNPGSVSSEQLLQLLQALDVELTLERRTPRSGIIIRRTRKPATQPAPPEREPLRLDTDTSVNPRRQSAQMKEARLRARTPSAGSGVSVVPAHLKEAKATQKDVAIVEAAASRLKALANLSEEQTRSVLDALRTNKTTTKTTTRSQHVAANSGQPLKPVVISLSSAEEIAAWAKKLRVTSNQLIEAIRSVGVKPVVQTEAKPNKGNW